MQSGVLCDAGQHARPDLDGIVKRPNVLAALWVLQNDVRTLLRLNCVPFSEKRAEDFAAFVLGHRLTLRRLR